MVWHWHYNCQLSVTLCIRKSPKQTSNLDRFEFYFLKNIVGAWAGWPNLTKKKNGLDHRSTLFYLGSKNSFSAGLHRCRSLGPSHVAQKRRKGYLHLVLYFSTWTLFLQSFSRVCVMIDFIVFNKYKLSDLGLLWYVHLFVVVLSWITKGGDC